LKPSPTGRLRRVHLHLSYSRTLSHLLDTTSHTTGRAVFRIRRLNSAISLFARSDGIRKPKRFSIAFDKAVWTLPLVASLHAPCELKATFSIRPRRSGRRSERSRPTALCHRCQKHFRMCLRIQLSSWNTGRRASASSTAPVGLHRLPGHLQILPPIHLVN
jgi:hypothetical protein